MFRLIYRSVDLQGRLPLCGPSVVVVTGGSQAATVDFGLMCVRREMDSESGFESDSEWLPRCSFAELREMATVTQALGAVYVTFGIVGLVTAVGLVRISIKIHFEQDSSSCGPVQGSLFDIIVGS